MQRTELYFGMTRPGGVDVMEIEFQTFLEQVVTPRFPQGYTVLNGQGHWREQQGRLRVEPTRVLVIFHGTGTDEQQKIEEIRSEYKKRFTQEAVLRVDDVETVSF